MKSVFPAILLVVVLAGCGSGPDVDIQSLKKYEGIYERLQGPGPADFYLQVRSLGEPAIKADVVADLSSVNQGWECDDGFWDRVCVQNDFNGTQLHYRRMKGFIFTRIEQDLTLDFSEAPVLKVIDTKNSQWTHYAWRGRW